MNEVKYTFPIIKKTSKPHTLTIKYPAGLKQEAIEEFERISDKFCGVPFDVSQVISVEE